MGGRSSGGLSRDLVSRGFSKGDEEWPPKPRVGSPPPAGRPLWRRSRWSSCYGRVSFGEGTGPPRGASQRGSRTLPEGALLKCKLLATQLNSALEHCPPAGECRGGLLFAAGPEYFGGHQSCLNSSIKWWLCRPYIPYTVLTEAELSNS